jgi:hypothetical protein
MGGSFESGAGDDPNDLFADDESENEDEADAESPEPEQAAQSEEGGLGDATGGSDRTDSTGETGTDTGQSTVETADDGPDTAMLEVAAASGIDGARLARAFVPEDYEKPHAWALGRDGVNDGRPEKKTFFLQSSVLDLEAACSQEVNEILDGDVPLTDLRELALILAYHQPELLAEAAREWGAESA